MVVIVLTKSVPEHRIRDGPRRLVVPPFEVRAPGRQRSRTGARVRPRVLTSVSRVLTANRPVLRWCIRHYEAERQLAEDLLTDLETLNKRGRLPRNRESPLAAPKSTPRHG